ncbi:MAG: outer membrane beta-barrel protein [Gemmatimonadales bacterium]|nr:outer membrane beta-barrel protein [Gemmatimonadales bacterium]
MRVPRPSIVLLALLLASVASTAAAQYRGRDRGPRDRFPRLEVLGGVSHYDIDRTDTGPVAALRLALPSGRYFVFEPGIGLLRFENRFDEGITYLMPELSVQVEPIKGPFRPYVGVGAGLTEFLSGRGTNFATMHAAAGVRANIGDRFGLRGDVRARTIDPFRQSTLDLMVGVSWRLGGRD